jgi:hypothetical protein
MFWKPKLLSPVDMFQILDFWIRDAQSEIEWYLKPNASLSKTEQKHMCHEWDTLTVQDIPNYQCLLWLESQQSET